MKKLIAFFGFVLCCFLGQAEDNYKIKSLRDLPEHDVNCFLHDSRGFMWIGTLDGLHRYDGYGYKTITSSNTKGQLTSNMVMSLAEDSKGNLWIGTYGKGLCKYDPFSDSVVELSALNDDLLSSIPNDMNTMIIDRDNFIWLGGWDGLVRITLDSLCEQITDVHKFSFLDEAGVRSIIEDREGNVWVGTNSSVSLIKDKFTQNKTFEMSSFDCMGAGLCTYKDGVVAVGGSLTRILPTYPEGYSMDVHHLKHSGIRVYNTQQKIWIGSRQGVQSYISDINGNLIECDTLDKHSSACRLSSNYITAFSEDNLGRLWIGSRGGGVDILTSGDKPFAKYQGVSDGGVLIDNLCRSLFEDSKHNLWIGSEDEGMGFLAHDKHYGDGFVHIRDNSVGAGRTNVYAELNTEVRNIIYVGTSYPDHLVAYDRDTQTRLDIGSTRSLGLVFTMAIQNDSTMWVGTYGKGMWRLHLDNNGRIIDQKQFLPDEHGSRLSSLIIRDLSFDHEGNLWIGTDKGLNCIAAGEVDRDYPFIGTIYNDLGQDVIREYVLQIVPEDDGQLWVATMGHGLIKCTKDSALRSYSAQYFTEESGLPNNTIKAIVKDRNGYLWLSSNNGLTQWNPHTNTAVNFDEYDGLQNHEFSEKCGIIRANGELVFGGIKGINVFNPSAIGTDSIKPELFLTGLSILNNPISPGTVFQGEYILDTSIEFAEDIRLKHKHNSFAIEFMALQYNMPQKHSYRYILEGFDNEWSDAVANQRVAKYTNIPAGRYTFKFIASNGDKIWNDTPKTLGVVIAPPPYLSNHAILLYVVLFIVLVVLAGYIIILFNRRKKEELKAKIEKEQIETLSKQKLQFFTSISHEFRTPLTLIMAPLEQLMERPIQFSEKQVMQKYNLIRQNVDAMLNLIDQLMTFRKLESGKGQLAMKRFDIIALTNQVVSRFHPLAEEQSVGLHFHTVIDRLYIEADADKVERLMFNLLSNAFKFIDKGGDVHVSLSYNEESNETLFHVKDSGVGIEPSIGDKIFERYYQAPVSLNRGIGGTGIGLSLCKSIVEQHQGRLWYESNGKEPGTTFSFTLKGERLSQPTPNDESLPVLQTDVPVLPSIELASKSARFDEYGNGLDSTILVVEDNIEIQQLLVNTLSDVFHVVTANNGEEGLEKCTILNPSLVITDVMMPVMDGIAMCRAIKSDENISHIPVVMLTAKSRVQDQIEGYQTKADLYLSKPFSPTLLKAGIISLIDNRATMRDRFHSELPINPDLVSNTPVDAQFMRKILCLIEENLSDSSFNVEKLAIMYGVSRVCLNRKIKATTGETANHFIRNIRLKYAAEMLRNNQYNVSEVTWKCGYNDLRTFRTRFKEKFGISPSEYVKKRQEAEQ